MTTTPPTDRLPRYAQGSHGQLPDGTTATVLTQRGTTVWLTPNGDAALRTVRADDLTIL